MRHCRSCFWCWARWAFFVELFPSLYRSYQDIVCLTCRQRDHEQDMAYLIGTSAMHSAGGGYRPDRREGYHADRFVWGPTVDLTTLAPDELAEAYAPHGWIILKRDRNA